MLKEFADVLDYKLLCDPDAVKNALEEDGEEGSAIMQRRDRLGINPVFINDFPEACCYTPWEHSK